MAEKRPRNVFAAVSVSAVGVACAVTVSLAETCTTCPNVYYILYMTFSYIYIYIYII